MVGMRTGVRRAVEALVIIAIAVSPLAVHRAAANQAHAPIVTIAP